MKVIFDRLDVTINNFGGDPYETIDVSVQKFGDYSFRYNRRKSTYFYADQQETSPGHLYDLHTFNFDRVADTGSLRVWLGNYVDLFLNFDSYTKKGDSVTTLDINRTEFEFEKPIEEDFKQVSFGINVHVKGYTFSFEERIQDYDNSNSYFLPGFADGGAGARYPSSLSLFVLNQPYNLDTNSHIFRLNARPFGNLLIQGSAELSDQDMNLSYSEEAAGINFLNRPFQYSQGGQGNFERKLRLYDFDLTYLLFDKLAVIGGIRYHDFNQTGAMTIDGELQAMSLGYNTLGIEGGLQYQFSPKVALSVGYRHESRELEGIETVNFEEETTRNGLYGNLKWIASRAFSLTCDYQFGTYDNPFSLISPSKFNRFRSTARLRLDNWSASGSWLYSKTTNDVFDVDNWDSSRNQLTLRVGYNTEKVNLFAGYSLIDVEHNATRAIGFPPGWSGPAGTFPWEIMYEGESNLWDAYLKLNVNEQWNLGAYANLYKNNGFWEISRTTLKAFVEYTFENGLITQVGYRLVDFEEAFSGRNDYQANIFEVSFGYRWDR
jgi:hypothetical protein